jgi:hypothetical protein
MYGRTGALICPTWLKENKKGTSNINKISRQDNLLSLLPINPWAFKTNGSARADRYAAK